MNNEKTPTFLENVSKIFCDNDQNDGQSSIMKVSRMDLNTTKAGMDGLDKNKINQIIYEASKGSKFYENERKKEQQVQKRITELRRKMVLFTAEQRNKAHQFTDKLVQELEKGRDLSRIIVHVDMDAFFAAVEMRDDPSLKSKPMAVGGNAMLSTSNYLARRFGVRAAMPGFIAKKLCPNLIIVPLNYEKYKEVSYEIRDIFAEYDPNFLPTSLDEAYLDITHYVRSRQRKTSKVDTSVEQHERQMKSPKDQSTDERMFDGDVYNTVEEVVKEMRRKIEDRTQLTASAGIASNMFLAKVCSDRNKPNGQFFLKPEKEEIMRFVSELPLRKAYGIGRVSEQILTSVLDVKTCSQLYDRRGLMQLLFTPTALRSYLEISLGLGSNVVDVDRERKSISTETTFKEINKLEDHLGKCRELCEELSQSLKKRKLSARKIGVKLKTINFEVKTRISTAAFPVQRSEELFSHAKKLILNEIRSCIPEPLRLRLMGVRAAELCEKIGNDGKQLTITSLMKNERTGIVQPSKPSPCFSSKETESDVCDLTESAQSSSAQVFETSKKLNSKGLPNVVDKYEKSDQSSKPDVVTSQPAAFKCPVCGKNFTFKFGDPLLQMNTHVDTCLKKQDLLKNSGNQKIHGKSITKKRKREPSHTKNCKRKPMDRFLAK